MQFLSKLLCWLQYTPSNLRAFAQQKVPAKHFKKSKKLTCFIHFLYYATYNFNCEHKAKRGID